MYPPYRAAGGNGAVDVGLMFTGGPLRPFAVLALGCGRWGEGGVPPGACH